MSTMVERDSAQQAARDRGSIAAECDSDSAKWRAISPTLRHDWRNTLRPILKPVACWRIQNAYFDFDSSVILPGIRDELTSLRPLIQGERLATIFGHADPVGTIEYNAHLSARRARSLFALLTRNAYIWDHLFVDSQPYDQWGLASTQLMLATLAAEDGSPYYTGSVDGAYGPLTDQSIRSFQGEQHEEESGAPLVVDGIAGPKTRMRLYLLYMDALTGTPREPMMMPDQFLGDPTDNANPKGKARAACQGCSEHNPILLISEADQKKYAHERNDIERNQRNAPNRRAMIFFFSKRRILPLTPSAIAGSWPCPAWDEGPSKCRAQLWTDSDKRLMNGPEERRYAEGDETMACSWYDRLARFSPCERSAMNTELARCRFHFVLRAGADGSPVSDAAYRILDEGRIICEGTTDAQGELICPTVPLLSTVSFRFRTPSCFRTLFGVRWRRSSCRCLVEPELTHPSIRVSKPGPPASPMPG